MPTDEQYAVLTSMVQPASLLLSVPHTRYTVMGVLSARCYCVGSYNPLWHFNRPGSNGKWSPVKYVCSWLCLASTIKPVSVANNWKDFKLKNLSCCLTHVCIPYICNNEYRPVDRQSSVTFADIYKKKIQKWVSILKKNLTYNLSFLYTDVDIIFY